jgi:methionine--tRNA ligase beta chain
MVSFDEFKKIEMKVGRIENAERIEGADKLYKLTVDTGELRTIVAGIAQQYTAEELIGKEIIVVTNLDSRTLKGVESQGMLLAAEDGEIVSLLVPLKEIKPGSGVH